MKKIIIFSVALLISAATYAYSVPLQLHDAKPVHSERAGELGPVVPGFHSIPWLSLSSNSTSLGATGFSSRRQVAGLEYAPESSGIFQDPDNRGGTDPIPEPATIMLFGAGLIGLACMGRRRMMKNT